MSIQKIERCVWCGHYKVLYKDGECKDCYEDKWDEYWDMVDEKAGREVLKVKMLRREKSLEV